MTLFEKMDRQDMMPHMLGWLTLFGLYLTHNSLLSGEIVVALIMTFFCVAGLMIACLLIPPLLYLLVLLCSLSMWLQVVTTSLAEAATRYLSSDKRPGR
ncbi:hypothetical protein [Oceanobacter mangrovi]|uniref:hypothetical protein n=1 Tax=Oceanobacter mangrovi TaxID=2862510 RepID=UPI001C8DEC55|nr:hypothetical protein [Oceanobacter mangrovi]